MGTFPCSDGGQSSAPGNLHISSPGDTPAACGWLSGVARVLGLSVSAPLYRNRLFWDGGKQGTVSGPCSERTRNSLPHSLMWKIKLQVVLSLTTGM